MRLIITIDTDNDAFHPDPGDELARIMEDLSDAFFTASRDGDALRHLTGTVLDLNGNTTGTVAYRDLSDPAERVQAVLSVYDMDETERDKVRDALADLLLYCEKHGVPFEDAYWSAKDFFSSEKGQ